MTPMAYREPDRPGWSVYDLQRDRTVRVLTRRQAGIVDAAWRDRHAAIRARLTALLTRPQEPA